MRTTTPARVLLAPLSTLKQPCDPVRSCPRVFRRGHQLTITRLLCPRQQPLCQRWIYPAACLARGFPHNVPRTRTIRGQRKIPTDFPPIGSVEAHRAHKRWSPYARTTGERAYYLFPSALPLGHRAQHEVVAWTNEYSPPVAAHVPAKLPAACCYSHSHATEARWMGAHAAQISLSSQTRKMKKKTRDKRWLASAC